MTNKKEGNLFEQEFCEILFEKGFWVHNLAQNASGQPADVIAAKNGKALLIDCKVCDSNGFSFTRIESNQELSMNLWKDSGNGVGWFALRLPKGKIFMISKSSIDVLKETSSILSEIDIRKYGHKLDFWLEWFE